MKKYIYIITILCFANLSFAQYALDFPSSVSICADSGYALNVNLIETSTGNNITPNDLEFEIFVDIGTCSAFNPSIQSFFASDGYPFDINTLDAGGCFTSNYYNIRERDFQVRVKAYPDGHEYENYSNVNKIFKLKLHRSEALTIGGSSYYQMNYVGCSNPTAANLYSNNSIYVNGLVYYNNGVEIASNTPLQEGQTYQVYPTANSSPPFGTTGLCAVPPLIILVNSITVNTNNYTGPEFVSPYPIANSTISICNIQDIVTVTPIGSVNNPFPVNSNFILTASSTNGTSGGISFVDSYTGDLSSFFNLSSGIYTRTLYLYYVEDDPCHFERVPISLNITNEYNGTSSCIAFPRSKFSTGEDLDYDSNTNEDELTYKSIYNLFLKYQGRLINNYPNDDYPTPNVQPVEIGNSGILGFPDLSFNMFVNDSFGGFTQIPVADFDNPVFQLSDLLVNCDETFYFDITRTSGDCSGPFSYQKIPYCIRLYDVPTAYTNPDQYFCVEDNPTYSSLSIASSVAGNPLKVWDSEFGSGLIYDPNDSSSIDATLTEGTYWVSEFDIATIRCNTNFNDEIDSSQRFPVTVSIISGVCSPDTSECPCNSFELERGDKYIVSAWVKEDQDKQVITYDKAKLDVAFLEGDQLEAEFSFSPSGEIIEGWQRIVGEFFVPITATKIRIDLDNTNGAVISPGPVNIDDYLDDVTPTSTQQVIMNYEVTYVGLNFSNCNGTPSQNLNIRSQTQLLPDTVYRLRGGLIQVDPNQNPIPIDDLPYKYKYITIENPTPTNQLTVLRVDKVATISCEELSDFVNGSDLKQRVDVFYDDIRIHPFNGNMKSFVYDPITQRLMAELDENNYATMYEYDEEGGLIRVKKETEKGVFTIQETRSKSATKE